MNDETEYENDDLFGDLFTPERKKYQYALSTKIRDETIIFTSFCPPFEILSYLRFHRNFALIGKDVGLWIRKKDILSLQCVSMEEANRNAQNAIQGEKATI